MIEKPPFHVPTGAGADDTIEIILRPTEPRQLAYQIEWLPTSGSWRLRQGLRYFDSTVKEWRLEELVEFRFWNLDELVTFLHQLLDDIEPYFTVDGEAPTFGE